MARKRQPILQDISIERDGKHHSGTYTVQSGVVTVHLFGSGTKATQVGNSSAERIARILLSELVAEQR
jgi:hypothetical protein